MRHRRTNKIPKPWLQFKLIQPFLATAVICIVIQYAIVQYGLSALLTEDPATAELSDKAAAVTLTGLYITLPVTVLLIFALGIFFTFRLVGPMYGLEKYLKRIIAGQGTGTWRVRREDELQDLCDLLNQAVETLKAQPQVDDRGDSQTALPDNTEAEREVHTEATRR